MRHTSSIMDTGVYSVSASTIDSMLDISLKRRGNFSDKDPGKAYLYTNLGAGVVSSIMEAVTGESLNNLMNHLVFKAVGIDGLMQPPFSKARTMCLLCTTTRATCSSPPKPTILIHTMMW